MTARFRFDSPVVHCFAVASLWLAVGCSSGSGGVSGPVGTVDAGSAVTCGSQVCDDNNPCTDNGCNPQTLTCVFGPNAAACDDGNPCTGGDKCAAGSCVTGATQLCADGGPIDGGTPKPDGSAQDSGPIDGGALDSGSSDAGKPDVSVQEDITVDSSGKTPDAMTGDSATTGDTTQATDSTTDPTKSLQPGDLIITEIHYNPWGEGKLTDAKAEWFEVYNPTDKAIDMGGITIRDDGNDKYNILPKTVIISAKSYYVFGASKVSADNGGVAVDHAWGSSIQLNNSGKDAVILAVGSLEIDAVRWDPKAGWPFLNARSMNLDAAKIDAKSNDDAKAWCGAQKSMTSGDKGTPGAANSPCDYADADNDGVSDADDNCKNVQNPAQQDGDKDGVGDACPKLPVCGDKQLDEGEECDDGNKQSGDGCSDKCKKEDSDKDGITDDKDNCPKKPNKEQKDADKDTIGDVCDNCPLTKNTDQKDGNKDGQGDACTPAVCGDKQVTGAETCDDGNKDGGDGCSPLCEKSAVLKKGAVVVSELMINPDKVADNLGEYVELYNPGSAAVDINGLTLVLGASKHLISHPKPLWIQSKSYFVMGISKSSTTNGGITHGYVYNNFFLSNSGGDLQLSAGALLIDSVHYKSGQFGWPGLGAGASIQLSSTQLDATKNDAPTAWCKSALSYGAGDKGTPGKANLDCGKPAPVCGNKILETGEECEDGGKVPGDGCDANCKIEAPTTAKPGDLIITEIMPKSAAGTGDKGEYIEIHNRTKKIIKVGGLIVSYKGLVSTILTEAGGKTTLKPGEFVVIGHKDNVVNIPVDHAIGKIALSNASGKITLLVGGTEIDSVSYKGGGIWPTITTGASMQLLPSAMNAASNDIGGNWCLSAKKFGAALLLGSPGKATDCTK
ncbi:MAG: lamin tail domain-containing protein [Myxococcales bacterium]|nr:lamin tail domain-containing protein [Myxococcales bacterium]